MNKKGFFIQLHVDLDLNRLKIVKQAGNGNSIHTYLYMG